MAEAVTTHMRLRIVRDLQENGDGATLGFQDGGHAHLPRLDPRYALLLRLARRSQERQHPVGVSVGTSDVITDVTRADNDIPRECTHEPGGAARVLFLGHDGVFQVKPDHPDWYGIAAVLSEAIGTQSPVWFLAGKPDLALLDVSLVPNTCDLAKPTASTSGNAKAAQER